MDVSPAFFWWTWEARLVLEALESGGPAAYKKQSCMPLESCFPWNCSASGHAPAAAVPQLASLWSLVTPDEAHSRATLLLFNGCLGGSSSHRLSIRLALSRKQLAWIDWLHWIYTSSEKNDLVLSLLNCNHGISVSSLISCISFMVFLI